MIPSALKNVQQIAPHGRRPAIFLDYDGTLTPIVSHPEKALLSDSMRQALQSLVMHAPVAILSGRDLDDVRQRVNIGAIVYAGSHGFDIAGPRGLRKEMATEFLSKLDMIEEELGKQLAGIPGARLERKRFSIAAHYRNVNESDIHKVERAVSEVAARHRELRKMDGKKVYELLPDIDWDKGKAVLWLLENQGLERAKVRPIYIGDDRTDEDAFRALGQRGVGILVSEQPRPTSASYSLKDPTEVERFLRELVATLT
ncbi:MAG TPA: trehalose-phosphatase [Candidatus Udaeobacter sp.]|jgi:trehalose-phosphatase|nr:trehalose-phosphatase [Candidatus Udaeobacter sp.]